MQTKVTKLTRAEIAQWIDNDEGLYNWKRSSRLPLSKFITENREELTRLILAVVNREPGR